MKREVKNKEVFTIRQGDNNEILLSHCVEFEFENKIISGKKIHDINIISEQDQYKLKKAQQKLAKQEKYSSNWKKTQQKIEKIELKIANRRKDFMHKLTRSIVNKYSNIHIEESA